MRGIVRFFVSQTLFGNLLTAIVFIVGIYSISTIRKDLFPPVEFDVTLVTAILPGAAPDQIEKLLINPIEEAVREVDGIKKVQSSATDSRAVITLTLDPDARNPEKTNQDIQRAIDRVEDYPAEAEKPIVIQLEAGKNPVIELSIYSKEMPELELREWVRFIADELSLVKGVATITKTGWQKKERVVELDPKALAAKQVSIGEVIQSLRLNNIQLPAGDIQTGKAMEVAAKTDGEFQNVESIANSPIRKNFEGFGVRVKDLGRVYESLEDPSLIYRTNGEQSFKLIVTKKTKADALKVVEAVQLRMSELKSKLPGSIEYRFVNDFTQYLRNRIGILSSNMVVGIILVVGILAVFLPWRVAIVVAAGIPFAMLAGITLLQLMGFSLNLISMIGLIIVSGMLVDDAIVVVENIFRRMEDGDDLKTAVLEGTTEMVPAVTASVLTTVAAFSPMLFMTGIFGKFVFEIPVMVIVPLVVSLIEAFVVAPVHFTDWIGQKNATKMMNKLKEADQIGWYPKLLIYYKKYLEWSLRNRWKVFASFVGLLIFSGLLASQLRFILFPPDGIYSFFVRLDAKPGTTIEAMAAMTEEIEPYILSLPKEELKDFVTQVGIQQNDPNDPFTKRAAHYAQILVNLTPESERERNVTTVVEDLRKKIPKPQDAVKIHFEVIKGGPPQGKPISINILGKDFETLRLIASEIKTMLADIEGVTDIDDSEVLGKQEVKVRPRSEDLSRLGLTTQDVATAVRAAFAGIVATSNRNLDEDVGVRVRLKESDKAPLEQLQFLDVGNSLGNLIPVSRISDFVVGDSQLLIQHEKYKRVISVGAQVDIDKITARDATAIAMKKIKDISIKYPEYTIEFGGENEDTAESMASLARAFLIAAILIFSILILTFGSLLQPILVLSAIPLGFSGTMLGLFLHGKPISFMALLGIIALAGVIVNNSIIIIDFYNSALQKATNWQDAIVEASIRRLRPIILTSVTTVLGLAPTAYGIGGNDGFVASLALSLGWGLFLGSILTMLIFPALLGLLEGYRQRQR